MKKIIDEYSVIGIVGLAKNTGKTTTLNAILKMYENEKVGLTSIGLDGEEMDQVNYLPKPQILVKSGMIIATACGCLEASDIKYKLLEKTQLYTALGAVSIIEIISNGNMVIAGPTTNKELGILISKMKKYSQRIFVDGAFNRMTFANIANIEGIILATGAAVSPLMEKTIKQTKVVIDSFDLPKSTEYDDVPAHEMIIKAEGRPYNYSDKRFEVASKAILALNGKIESIYLSGAITPRLINFFINNKIKKFILICKDPTKLLISERDFSHVKKLGIKIKIINPCPLLFLTINPFSPIGYHYDADRFLKAMKKELTIPVYNVKKMELNYV